MNLIGQFFLVGLPGKFLPSPSIRINFSDDCSLIATVESFKPSQYILFFFFFQNFVVSHDKLNSNESLLCTLFEIKQTNMQLSFRFIIYKSTKTVIDPFMVSLESLLIHNCWNMLGNHTKFLFYLVKPFGANL